MLKSHEAEYMLSNGVGIYRFCAALINSKEGYVTVLFEEEPTFIGCDMDFCGPPTWYWKYEGNGS